MSSATLTKKLYDIERWTLIVAALLCATGLLALSRYGALSLTLGAGASAANAWAMRGLGTRILRAGSAAALVLLFNVKLLFLGFFIYLAMHYLPIQLIPFTVGISALPAAVFIVAFRSGGDSTATSEESHG